MATGMVLGAVAFAAAAIVELKIEVSAEQLRAGMARERTLPT